MIVPSHADPHFRTHLVLRLAGGGEEAEPDGTANESSGAEGEEAAAGAEGRAREGVPEGVEELARRVREAVRTWVSERFPGARDELAVESFHEGRTRVISLSPPGQVRTIRAEVAEPGGGSGGGATSEPRGTIWAFQAQTPDSDVRSRRWAYQVAVAPAGPAALRVSARVHHWMEVGEVGFRARRPEPGPPSFLRTVARLPGIQVTDGRDPLPLEPVPVPVGGGPDFVERLADPDRRVGIVYLSVTRPDARPALDPEQVAAAVALAGAVHVAGSPEVDAELDHFLSRDLRCYGGALRIYRPGLKPRAVGTHEAERHRYIPWRRLGSRPLDETVAVIAGELLKCIMPEDPEREPVTVAEVEALVRRQELARLREEAGELRTRSRGGLSADDARKLFKLNERLEEKVRSLEDDNAALARRAFQASERLEEVRETGPETRRSPPPGDLDAAALVGALRELPSTPAEALELASHLFPHRLRVLDGARDAAEDAPTDDAAMAWRLLVAMAEDLHALHFGEGADSRSALEIREAFENSTRFDVAFTESKSTKASARLRELRTVRYGGEDVELLWHVKWGVRPPKLLRAYYHPDPERKLLVIGWFGDHLETAGTRRM